MLGVPGYHTTNYRVCGKWKEGKAALGRQAPAGPVTRSGAPSREVRRAPALPQPSAEQLRLGDSCLKVILGGVLPRPNLQPLTNLLIQRAHQPLRRLQLKAPTRWATVKPAPKLSAAPKKILPQRSVGVQRITLYLSQVWGTRKVLQSS
jgi:hypothetical protein